MAKHIGSETFGTKVIPTEEYILMAQTFTDNGSSTEQAMLNIDAIDDMLHMHKMRSIIISSRRTAKGTVRKDVTLASFIDARLTQLVEDLKQV